MLGDAGRGVLPGNSHHRKPATFLLTMYLEAIGQRGGEYGLPQEHLGRIGSIGAVQSGTSRCRPSGSYNPVQTQNHPNILLSFSCTSARSLGFCICDLCSRFLLGISEGCKA